eukprot:775673-Alexandrium_andersonii.AAC.1
MMPPVAASHSVVPALRGPWLDSRVPGGVLAGSHQHAALQCPSSFVQILLRLWQSGAAVPPSGDRRPAVAMVAAGED